MLKTIMTTIALMAAAISAHAIEKLDSKYCVTYGEDDAPIKVVEYYSLNCPQCLYLFTKEFDYIKRRYINSGKVQWTFHPDPTTLQTLQAMMCLESLSGRKKELFFEELLPKLQGKDPASKTRVLKQLAYRFGADFPSDEQVEKLKETPAFKSAYKFVSQKDGVESVPTVEINGSVKDEMPSITFLERQFWKILEEKKTS